MRQVRKLKKLAQLRKDLELPGSGFRVPKSNIAQCVHCSVDCSEYKIELYMIQSNKLLLGINRVWDSEACLEPNSIDTEQ